VFNPNWQAILPALLVLGSAMAVLALELVYRRESVRARLDWVAYAGIAAAFFFVLRDIREGAAPEKAFGYSVVTDHLSLFVAIAVLAAAALAILQAPDYLKARGVYRAEYYALVLLSAVGMMLLAQANELITMFLCVELLSLSIYVLTGITRRDPRSNEAAVKYFVQGAFATGFLLYGMALVYGATGQVHLHEIGRVLRMHAALPPLAVAGVGLMIAGFAFKVGAVPFHAWVPDVYEGAPTIVTSFMSVAVKAAGVGALVRILMGPFGGDMEAWSGLLWGIAALTIVVGNLGAIAQRSVKRMLAFSSVAHTGYALVGLAAAPGNREAASSSLFYVFVYTFMTLGAFAFVAWAGRPPSPAHPHGRDAEDISDFAGLARTRPWAAAMMTILMVSLAGIPPTAGFLGKFLLFKGAIDGGYLWLAVVGIAGSLVSLWYYLRVVVTMYVHEPEAQTTEATSGTQVSDFNIWLAVVLCAALTLFFGVRPGDYIDIARMAVEHLR